MSRTVPRASGPNWLAAVVGAMFVAVVLALLTTPRTESKYPSPALPPAANATITTPTPAAATGTAKAQTPASVTRASYNMEAGQKIAIDPATGQSRPIEHDDVAPAPSAARQSFASPQATIDPDGGMSIAIPDTSDVFTVATKGPDGKITIAHASGLAGATAKMREGGAKKKEVLNDR